MSSPSSPPTSKQPRPLSAGSMATSSSPASARSSRPSLARACITPLLQKPSRAQSGLSRVDEIYNLTKKLIVENQSVTTGLFPRQSTDQSIGYVKDSIYCALACWACSIAYRRLDDDRGRQTELRQTAVKTMRGILFCWMQQVDKINSFKHNNSHRYALHCRFNLQTGMELPTPYNHLQMDLVALYILALVEMTCGGTQIIYTSHEVAFLQNLVFYIERTYRTPDFGMWERGTRYNVGMPELHASSLGLVKAALESVNGWNAYGHRGTSESVIYVDIDGHNRNRTTFETILPRESNSKHTDAALLLVLGWPAFATHDEKLYEQTLSKCIRRLEGRYGIRRYLRDGYRTECEDATRRFYIEEETFKFQGIESQFPLFLAVIAISAQFRGNQALSDRYWQKFKSLVVAGDFTGTLVPPECYCIDDDHTKSEKEVPNSQDFYALNPLEFGCHLWSCAIYIVCLLLREKLIHLTDIDPIYRHLPASQRPKTVNRHSAFEGSMEGDPVVQVALIAESVQLQMMLATYGIPCQTPHEVEPVQIWSSWRLVKVFTAMGKDEKMNLGGRPPRPLGPLSTSKIYRICGETVIAYPLLFDLSDFYINVDPSTLIQDIRRDVEFVAKSWKLAGRPTFCIVLREENVVGDYFDDMLDLLVNLKNGYLNGIRVRIGRIHQLLNTGCIEHVDFANLQDIDLDASDAGCAFEEVDAKAAHLKMQSSLKPVPPEDHHRFEKEFRGMDDHTLFQYIAKHDEDNLRIVAFAIAIMQKRYTSSFVVQGENLAVRMEKIYRQACQWHHWWLVRYCAAKLRKTVTSLAPGITSLLAKGKQVTVLNEITIGAPSTPLEIANILFASCPEDEPHAAVFQQELVIACADLIAKQPSAFDGILTIRLSWLTKSLDLLLNYIKADMREARRWKKEESSKPLNLASFLEFCPSGIIRQLDLSKDVGVYDLPPTVVKDLLSALVTKKNWHLLSPLQARRLNGALNRVPTNLYDRVWKILERVKGGIIIAGHHLPQDPTLKVMTQEELNFSYKIESMMKNIAHPEYRQILVELFCIIATIMERNPVSWLLKEVLRELGNRFGKLFLFGSVQEIRFVEALDCDLLIKEAFYLFCEEQRIRDRVDMTPFYEIDDGGGNATTSSFLIRVVVDKLLKDTNIKYRFSILGDGAIGDLIMREQRWGAGDDSCLVS